jgi:AhpD family alkylhydroperoxidase
MIIIQVKGKVIETARIPDVKPTELPAEVQSTLAALPDLNLFRLVAHASSTFRPFLAYGGALLSGLDLDPRLRELAILRVAALSGCEYEVRMHVPIAREVGVADEAIEAAIQIDGLLGGVPGLVLDAAAAATHSCSLSATLMDKLLADLGPRPVVELLLLVGHYRGLAVLMNAAEIGLDEPIGSELVRRADRRSCDA